MVEGTRRPVLGDSTDDQKRHLNSLEDCFAWAQSKVDRKDAERLLEHVFSTTTSQLYTNPSLQVTAESAKDFSTCVNRRSRGEPVEYITEECYFWTHKLRVTPNVLIPRPETEVLVETALQFLQNGDRVLDLGAGSGAIALALSSELNLKVVAADIDLNALTLSRDNADRLGLDVEMIHSDWYSSVKGSFNVIVSNPPYVAASDPLLTQSELCYEPRVALASRKNGLEALETVILGSTKFLDKGGHLLVEHGFDQRDPVIDFFKRAGFCNIKTRNDYGTIPRVVIGERGE